MQEIDFIYKNHFGLSFYWVKSNETLRSAIQIVFRDMGFYLSREEVIIFSKLIDQAKQQPQCNSCNVPNCSRSILLRTPFSKVDLVLNQKELNDMQDLINGILFHTALREYLERLSLN